MVRPVIPHIAGIVVGHWRNGSSYRNIAREVGLHSNTVYGIIKRFREGGNFVCGRCTRRPRKTDRVLYRLAREIRRFSVQKLRRAWQPNVNFAISRQTVNRRLVARTHRARRMVKVPRLTARAKLVRRHQSATRPMATCHILRRKSIRALPDRQSDPCSNTGGEAMNKYCTCSRVDTYTLTYMSIFYLYILNTYSLVPEIGLFICAYLVYDILCHVITKSYPGLHRILIMLIWHIVTLCYEYIILIGGFTRQFTAIFGH